MDSGRPNPKRQPSVKKPLANSSRATSSQPTSQNTDNYRQSYNTDPERPVAPSATTSDPHIRVSRDISGRDLPSHQPHVHGSTSGYKIATGQPFSPTASLSNQGYDVQSTKLATQKTYYSNPPGLPVAIAYPAAPDQPTVASREVNRPRQVSDAVSAGTSSQTSVSGSPGNTSWPTSGQPPPQYIGGCHQQSHDTNSAKPNAQTTSRTSGYESRVDPSVTTSDQPISDFRNRSQQMVPAKPGPLLNDPRKNCGQPPTQWSGSQYGHDLGHVRPAIQMSYHEPASGPPTPNTPSVASNQPDPVSQGPGNRLQQVHHMDYTKTVAQTSYKPPAHEPPENNFQPASGQPPSQKPGSLLQQGYGFDTSPSITRTSRHITAPGHPVDSSSKRTLSQQVQNIGSDRSYPNHVPMASSHPFPVPQDTVRHAQEDYVSGRPRPNVQILPVSGPPSGRDLTGNVKILPYPGKPFNWPIGNGAFTDVYEGEMKAGIDFPTPTLVAVKLFRAPTGQGPGALEATSRRLIRESHVWLRLKHPNVQPYFGHCTDLGLSAALISPLCRHGSIMGYIEKQPSSNRLQLVKDVAEGLMYLHSEEVIHADLHCNNILVDDEGRARLTDFGRAKVLGEPGYSTALMAGCAPYMAPELFPPSESVVNVDKLFSKHSDVYSFAMVSFEIFTGEIPFSCYKKAFLGWHVVPLICDGKRPQCTTAVQDRIPQNMWRIMEVCWTQEPKSRISAGEIIRRIRILS